MDKKILLVDDAAFMRMLIKDALTKNGYTSIIEAADGQIAVDTYNAEKPALVIMDITMPNKTGIEALQEIKSKDPAAKVIMCSAMGQEAILSRLFRRFWANFWLKIFPDRRFLRVGVGIFPLNRVGKNFPCGGSCQSKELFGDNRLFFVFNVKEEKDWTGYNGCCPLSELSG